MVLLRKDAYVYVDEFLRLGTYEKTDHKKADAVTLDHLVRSSVCQSRLSKLLEGKDDTWKTPAHYSLFAAVDLAGKAVISDWAPSKIRRDVRDVYMTSTFKVDTVDPYQEYTKHKVDTYFDAFTLDEYRITSHLAFDPSAGADDFFKVCDNNVKAYQMKMFGMYLVRLLLETCQNKDDELYCFYERRFAAFRSSPNESDYYLYYLFCDIFFVALRMEPDASGNVSQSGMVGTVMNRFLNGLSVIAKPLLGASTTTSSNRNESSLTFLSQCFGKHGPNIASAFRHFANSFMSKNPTKKTTKSVLKSAFYETICHELPNVSNDSLTFFNVFLEHCQHTPQR